jgi:SAM-dependent methyltransferase
MGTGRLQTVRREWNPLYYDLVQQFGQATGTPVLLNTSFNLRSEPIVSSPADAFNTFSKSDLDMLVLGRFVVSKEGENQPGKHTVMPSSAEKTVTSHPRVKVVSDPLFSQLICPVCHGPVLSANGVGEALNCVQCGRRFPVENGIPLLYWPTEDTDLDNVTDIVKQFYEANPFPGYQGTDTAQRLVEKARRGIFAKMLDDQIPPQASVLEVGCGTGQLSNFLAVSGRVVYGADLCLNSLKLGRQFSVNNALDSVHFVQMNLYKPIFPAESFDYVLCNGALPAVHDPFGGFRSIARLVRPGGYIVVGLYNWYGRLWNDLRRAIFNLTGDRFQFLDPHLARTDLDDEKKRVWFMDQYKHPQEIKHTTDEVLGWFDQTGFEFVNGLPKVTPLGRFSEFELLFDKNPRGSRLDHLLAQLQQILSGGPEGGFFVMIGQKKQN